MGVLSLKKKMEKQTAKGKDSDGTVGEAAKEKTRYLKLQNFV